MSKPKPIGITWLASYPKSGNTWVRALVEAYRRNGTVDINGMTEVMSDSILSFYQCVLPMPVAQAGKMAPVMVRPAALIQMISAARSLPIMLKTHQQNSRVRDCYPLIPDELTARSIYIVRDPRDIAPSYARHMGISVDDAIERMTSKDSLLTGGQYVESFLGRWDGGGR